MNVISTTSGAVGHRPCSQHLGQQERQQGTQCCVMRTLMTNAMLETWGKGCEESGRRSFGLGASEEGGQK
jgi:hypothetical protein